MKLGFRFKLSSKHLQYALGGLALILVAMGVLGLLGVHMPDKVSKSLSDGVIIAALVVLFYGRKLRTEEFKAAAARAEKEKAENPASQE